MSLCVQFASQRDGESAKFKSGATSVLALFDDSYAGKEKMMAQFAIEAVPEWANAQASQPGELSFENMAVQVSCHT